MKLNIALTSLAMAVLPVIAAWSMQAPPEATAQVPTWIGLILDRGLAVVLVIAIMWWIHKVGFPTLMDSQRRLLDQQQQSHERDWKQVAEELHEHTEQSNAAQREHNEQTLRALRDVFGELKELNGRREAPPAHRT